MPGMILQENDKIDYFEIPVSNIKKSKSFFAAAFDWQFVDYGDVYCEFSDGRFKGGLALTDKVITGGAMIILYHENLDASRSRVIAAGGTITREVFSFPGGERYEFSDPDGHIWAVWRKIT